jgi:phosphate:Na+ symporter
MKKFTSSEVKSFLSGIFTTAILQSSNVMSVLVLAFVGTGILSLTSALAVIL